MPDGYSIIGISGMCCGDRDHAVWVIKRNEPNPDDPSERHYAAVCPCRTYREARLAIQNIRHNQQELAAAAPDD